MPRKIIAASAILLAVAGIGYLSLERRHADGREPATAVTAAVSSTEVHARSTSDPSAKVSDSPGARSAAAVASASAAPGIGNELVTFLALVADEEQAGPAPDIRPLRSSDIPKDNGLHYFLLASELMKDPPDRAAFDDAWERFLNEGWTEDPVLIELIALNQEAIDAVRKGLEVGSSLFPPFAHGFSEDLSYLGRWRQLARVMVLEASMLSQAGDGGAALTGYMSLAEFGNMFPAGGSAVHGFLGYEFVRMGLSGIQEMIRSRPSATRAQLEDALSRLIGIETASYSAADLLRAEFLQLNLRIESERDRNGLRAFLLETLVVSPAIAAATDDELDALYANYLDDQLALIALSALPFSQLVATSVDSVVSSNPLSRMLLTALTRSYGGAAENLAQIRGTATMFGLELYRDDHGEYPATLQALVPNYLGSLLSDPFTGRNFDYRADASGYYLSSPGHDVSDAWGNAYRWNSVEGGVHP